MTQRILITGGQGFVGKALAASALNKGQTVRVSSSRKAIAINRRVECCQVNKLGAKTDWSAALQGVNIVVHCAARVHVLNDTSTDRLTEYHSANVEGTLNLAHQAVKAQVRRFLFLSTVGVNGEATYDVPFDESSAPTPCSDYASSKYKAEQGLLEISAKSTMEIVIIRPPLVYGPNAPGNFGKLLNFIIKSYPCPLGAIRNRRSLVSIYNLIDFIGICLEHPAAANQTFLVADGEDLSTTDLLRRLAWALNVPARLLPVPQELLQFVLKMVGRSDLAQRLCGSLQVDISKARVLLGWDPPISVDEGLYWTAQGYTIGLPFPSPF